MALYGRLDNCTDGQARTGRSEAPHRPLFPAYPSLAAKHGRWSFLLTTNRAVITASTRGVGALVHQGAWGDIAPVRSRQVDDDDNGCRGDWLNRRNHEQFLGQGTP